MSENDLLLTHVVMCDIDAVFEINLEMIRSRRRLLLPPLQLL